MVFVSTAFSQELTDGNLIHFETEGAMRDKQDRRDEKISSELVNEVQSAVKSIRGKNGTASEVLKRLESDAQSDVGATVATLSMASPPVPIRKPVQVSTNWDLDTEPE